MVCLSLRAVRAPGTAVGDELLDARLADADQGELRSDEEAVGQDEEGHHDDAEEHPFEHSMNLAVVERLEPGTSANFCFVMVRREQIDSVLPDLKAATLVPRIIFMVNHANGSEDLFEALGRDRVVLGFPSVAGNINNGVVEYIVVAEQPTVLESTALDVVACVRSARLRVKTIADMDSWLKRHRRCQERRRVPTTTFGFAMGSDGGSIRLRMARRSSKRGMTKVGDYARTLTMDLSMVSLGT
jgi:hypothetical protein